MDHHGPMFDTHDITGWTAEQLAVWVRANPDWGHAQVMSCHCEICGDVTELVRERQ